MKNAALVALSTCSPLDPASAPLASAGALLSVAPTGSGSCQQEQAAQGGGDRDVIVSSCAVVHTLVAHAKQIAASKISVLIEGESGTGKELIARLIHASSPRSLQPFVRVNCAALSESLVESELFGHEKGAFTGAEEARPGRFELANGGTLLLDEISEIPLRIQAKLLRVLEEEEFERVGGSRTLPSDVRILATTNRELEREVASGSFRRDLFYRLNAVQLQLPPLRDRRDDIGVLAQYFVQCYRHHAKCPVRGIAGKTLQIMMAYSWPGNVRQLRNALHRACLLTDGPDIRPDDLPPLVESPVHVSEINGRTLADMERHLILHTLREVGGNKTVAAGRLGVTTRTLLNKLNKYRQLNAA
jgi:transcriptional regulator with PAS, ATPase and Fis domain